MLPDIVGYPLEKGKEILLSSGFSNIDMIVTKSPFNSNDSVTDHCRILRAVEICHDEIELLVCYM
ncbi:hypothetical protein [Petroclostridium sp. X23]|uniref:hypothetical protein n=1 Tax=Petroclostridium sp. X23 TaxID=3045146 RepID=UPI0024AE3783|nr:hypothetical protein [Petroclostridium sp. X23]WHH58970.1 hypothetical protein QKW49_24785 [Petroclostridium sp. X23]